MQDYSAMIADSLQQCRKGKADSLFSLIDAHHDILPDLIAAFENESDAETASFLVEVIWQHRQPSAIPFLGKALYDPRPAVWKQALDGIVTLASRDALVELRNARDRQFSKESDASGFRRWLEEAIDQTEAACRDQPGAVADVNDSPRAREPDA